MNELLFLIHVLIVVIFLLTAVKMGKNYLLVLVALQAIIANLFVIKQINLFTKTLTPTDVFIIGTILAENLLQEYYGKKEAVKAIKISFFSMLFFLIMAKMQLLYLPSKYDVTHLSFYNILSHSPRIILSSICVFYLAQRLDVLFFGFLKKVFKDKHLVFRIIISAIVVQAFDTIAFTTLALRSLVESIFDIMLVSFLVKITVILLAAPFMKLSKLLIKKASYE